MKTIKKYLKTVAFLLSAIILIQGCSVYKSNTVSLEQAYRSDKKVKVVTNNKTTFKFNRIDKVDGKYYGIKKQNGEEQKMFIQEDDLLIVKEKDAVMSTVVSIIVPLGLTIGFVALIASNRTPRVIHIDLPY